MWNVALTQLITEVRVFGQLLAEVRQLGDEHATEERGEAREEHDQAEDEDDPGREPAPHAPPDHPQHRRLHRDGEQPASSRMKRNVPSAWKAHVATHSRPMAASTVTSRAGVAGGDRDPSRLVVEAGSGARRRRACLWGRCESSGIRVGGRRSRGEPRCTGRPSGMGGTSWGADWYEWRTSRLICSGNPLYPLGSPAYRECMTRQVVLIPSRGESGSQHLAAETPRTLLLTGSPTRAGAT